MASSLSASRRSLAEGSASTAASSPIEPASRRPRSRPLARVSSPSSAAGGSRKPAVMEGPAVMRALAMSLPASVSGKKFEYPTDIAVEVNSSASAKVVTRGLVSRSATKNSTAAVNTVEIAVSMGSSWAAARSRRFKPAYERSSSPDKNATAASAARAGTARSAISDTVAKPARTIGRNRTNRTRPSPPRPQDESASARW
jgi:hypothetical protein